MVRPVLRATLFALEQEIVDRLGGYGKITLADMARVYREGSGDCGICFEYAIHDAIRRRDPSPPWQWPFLLAFAGVRGIVSLAAALAIPFTTASGAPFPSPA